MNITTSPSSDIASPASLFLSCLLLVLSAFAVPPAVAQQAPSQDPLSLSLDGAIERAELQSEEVRLAQAQVILAEARVASARSVALPHVSVNLNYTRTFASPFSSGGGGVTIPDSLRFDPDPTAPMEERVSYLEQNVQNAALGSLGNLFGDLPFGQENSYAASLSASQVLFAGGSIRSGLQAAHRAVATAESGLAQARAGLTLQVQSAYYQTLLARRLTAIADSALTQAERFLRQERLRFEEGRTSELDVLRAEVNLENLRPRLVQARNAADLAARNLKRLLNIPDERSLRLTTRLEVPAPAELAAPRLIPAARRVQDAAIEAANHQVSLRKELVDVRQAAYWPSISLQMNYGKQIYPNSMFDFGGDWRTNWTVSLGIQIPIFDGLQRKADVDEAQAQLVTARLQLTQLKEASHLQFRQALSEKERAAALIGARRSTVDQAQRVYELTLLRYQKGLATQLEVSNARLSLLEARTNLAQALTTYYTAGATLLNTLGGRAADSGAAAQQQEPSTPDTATPTASPASGGTMGATGASSFGPGTPR